MKSEKTILDLNSGAILDSINHGMLDILDNISNKDTDSTKARELTIKLSFKPNEERDLVEMTATVKSKLAPMQTIKNILRNVVVSDDDTGEAIRVLKEYSDVPEGQMTIDGTEVVKETIAIKANK